MRTTQRASAPVLRREHLALYFAHGKGHGAQVIALIREIIADVVRAVLAASLTVGWWDDVTRDAAVEHLAGAFMTLLTWWPDRGAEIPAERMDALYRRIAVQGVDDLVASAPLSPPREDGSARPA